MAKQKQDNKTVDIELLILRDKIECLIYEYESELSICIENFSVVAESYDEALDKVNSGDYYIEPSLDDVHWDFGFRESEEELPRCYTLEECDE